MCARLLASLSAFCSAVEGGGASLSPERLAAMAMAAPGRVVPVPAGDGPIPVRCSVCGWARPRLDRRSRCRWCAVLRRLHRLQCQYRVSESVLQGLVAALEGLCAALEAVLWSTPGVRVARAVAGGGARAGELLADDTSEDEVAAGV